MGIKFANNASTRLSVALTAGATSMTVDSTYKFPVLGATDYFYATLTQVGQTEVVRVTAITGNVLTVVRGQDGTSALDWNAEALLELRVNAEILRQATGSAGILQLSNNITADILILPTNNGISAGPITINSGVTVTIPSISTWIIV